MAIRDARLAGALTQQQVADAMDWSLSKMMRIESGEVTISQNDLKPLLTYLGIKDRNVVDALVRAAKASRQRQQWWDKPEFSGRLTPAMKQLISFEAEASVVRNYYPAGIPGVLQTTDYARSVLNLYSYDLEETDIQARVAARTRWKNDFMQRQPRTVIYSLFDESMPLRQIGAPRVLGEQLVDLVKAIEAGWLVARIAPFTSPNPNIGSFDIVYLGTEAEDPNNAVLYRESFTQDEIIDDPAQIAKHRTLWDRMWSTALDERESVTRIKSRAEELTQATIDSSGQVARGR